MANEIHPTAIIDPKAELGEDIVVGPYCVVYAGVKIGDGCHLQNHVTIDGPTEIGKGNIFYAYSSIGQRTQDLKYNGEPTFLKIGDYNTFREFCTMNRATAPEDATVIGNHCNFLAYSHVGHDSIVGDYVIFSNNGTLGGHAVVGDHAVVGGLAGVHQYCRIGAHAIIGGCAKVVQDIPPFMMADGSPAKVRAINKVGMKRRGFSDEAVASVKRAHRILYREKRNTSEALAALRELEDPCAEVISIIDFVASSERGIS